MKDGQLQNKAMESEGNGKSKGLEERRPHGGRWNDLRREGALDMRDRAHFPILFINAHDRTPKQN